MFCPKCATQNLEGASYCRSCGANISLIPHALTGQLPQKQSEQFDFGRRGWKRGRESSIDHAFKNVFMGIAFLFVSIALSFSPMRRGSHQTPRRFKRSFRIVLRVWKTLFFRRAMLPVIRDTVTASP